MSDSAFTTAADLEQFDTDRIDHEQDTTDIAPADISEAKARRLVTDLVDTDVVTPISGDRVLVHEPSSTAFDSIIQLAVFHQGWTAAQDRGVEDE